MNGFHRRNAGFLKNGFAVSKLRTVGTRKPDYSVIFNHNQFILWQIIWNIIAFVPMGNALYYLLDRTEYSHGGDRKRKFYKVVLSCGIFSAGIELIQLFFRIGLFEFDDIVHNTLGAVIGYGIAEVGKRFLTFVAGK